MGWGAGSANSLGPDTYGGDWGDPGLDAAASVTDGGYGGGWDSGSANSLGPDTYGGDWGGSPGGTDTYGGGWDGGSANSLGPDTYGGDWGGVDLGGSDGGDFGGWDSGSANSLGPDTYGDDWGGSDMVDLGSDGGGFIGADMLGDLGDAISSIGSSIADTIGGLFSEEQHSVNKENPNFTFADKTTPGRGYVTIDKTQATPAPNSYSDLSALNMAGVGPATVDVPGIGTITSPGSIAPGAGSMFTANVGTQTVADVVAPEPSHAGIMVDAGPTTIGPGAVNARNPSQKDLPEPVAPPHAFNKDQSRLPGMEDIAIAAPLGNTVTIEKTTPGMPFTFSDVMATGRMLGSNPTDAQIVGNLGAFVEGKPAQSADSGFVEIGKTSQPGAYTPEETGSITIGKTTPGKEKDKITASYVAGVGVSPGAHATGKVDLSAARKEDAAKKDDKKFDLPTSWPIDIVPGAFAKPDPPLTPTQRSINKAFDMTFNAITKLQDMFSFGRQEPQAPIGTVTDRRGNAVTDRRGNAVMAGYPNYDLSSPDMHGDEGHDRKPRRRREQRQERQPREPLMPYPYPPFYPTFGYRYAAPETLHVPGSMLYNLLMNMAGRSA